PDEQGPSSKRTRGEEQKEGSGEERKGEGRDPTAVGDGEEDPGDQGFEEGQHGERRPPQPERHQARRGHAVILRRASARGVAGSQSTTWATRRSWATRFARSMARIR